MQWTKPTLQEIDKDLVKKATQLVKLNLSKDLFTSLVKKSTIQFLFSTYYTKTVDFYNEELSTVSLASLNVLIAKLRSEPSSRLPDIYDYKLEGEYGPGEVLLFLLVKGSTLGGRSSRAADLILPGSNYEVKAVQKDASGRLYDFTFADTDFNKILEEIKKIDTKNIPQTDDIGRTVINNLRDGKLPFDKLKSEKFIELEKQYQSLARNYFKSNAIFISADKKNLAEVLAVKTASQMKTATITIERYNQKQLKPFVKF